MTIEKVEPTETDKGITARAEAERKLYKDKLVEQRSLWIADTTNDYTLFIYMASLLDYIEWHNGGCLTELGLSSLKIDISPYIHSIKTGEPKLTQKNLLRLLLNILNSYAVSVLFQGMIEFSKETATFFEMNDFPTAIIDDKDFEVISAKLDEIIPKLKEFLDGWTKSLDAKYVKAFNEEKNKGFKKPLFQEERIRIGKLPSSLAEAKECK
jgi:uncharacterized membrane protein YwzB